MSVNDLLDKSKKDSIGMLEYEIGKSITDIKISDLSKYLKRKSEISINGRASGCVRITKEALRLASVYFNDMLLLLGE